MRGGTPSPLVGWYVVGLCMLAYVFSFIDRQILALLITPIQADLGITDTQFGLLHGLAFALFYAVMGIPVASLSDRKSRPLIIVLGLMVWSAATVISGFARSFALLFAARICVGAGEAALSPATYSLISDLFPRERLGRAVAVYSFGSFLGSGLAFLVGGSVIALVDRLGPWGITWLDAMKPWQLAFVAVGAPGILLGLIILITVRDPRVSQGGTVDAPGIGAVLSYLARHRAVFGPHLVGYSLSAMALFGILSWAPAYLIRIHGLTPQTSGYWLGLMAIFSGGGGVLASGWLMDRRTRAGQADAPFSVGIVGAAGLVVPIALLPVAPSLDVALMLLAVALFFASFPMPPSTAVMQIGSPKAMRSRVSAIFLFCNSLLGLALGSAMIGTLNDHAFGGPEGVRLSMPLVVALAGAGAALILAQGRRPFRRLVASL